MGRFGTTGTGKGSAFRPVDKKKFADNWEKAFGKAKESKGKDESR